MALVDGFLELERSSGKLEWSAILQKMASDLGFSKILFGLLPNRPLKKARARVALAKWRPSSSAEASPSRCVDSTSNKTSCSV
ncbi:hypothetical protein ABZR32_15000, partial [Pseudomonas aeruginosa]